MSAQRSVPGGQGSRQASAGPSWGPGLLIVIGVGIAYGLAYSILRLVGLGLSIYAPLGFLFPLDIILPVLFPATVPKAWADIKRAFSPAAWTGSEPDWPLLTLHITIGGFLLLMLGALLTGATHYLERYMHPFFLLTPLWMLSVVERTGRQSQGQGPWRHPRRVVPHCVPHQGKGLASCDGASLQQMP